MKQLSILTIATVLAGCSSIQIDEHSNADSAEWITEVPVNTSFVRPVFQYSNVNTNRLVEPVTASNESIAVNSGGAEYLDSLRSQVAELEEKIASLESRLIHMKANDSGNPNPSSADVIQVVGDTTSRSVVVVDFSQVYSDNKNPSESDKNEPLTESTKPLVPSDEDTTIDVVKIFNQRSAAYALTEKLVKAGDRDFFISNANGEWFVYLGRYYSASAARRRVGKLEEIDVQGVSAVTPRGRLSVSELV